MPPGLIPSSSNEWKFRIVVEISQKKSLNRKSFLKTLIQPLDKKTSQDITTTCPLINYSLISNIFIHKTRLNVKRDKSLTYFLRASGVLRLISVIYQNKILKKLW